MTKEAWIIDDNDTFVFVVKRYIQLLESSQKIKVFNEARRASEELKRRIKGKEELPGVILLDINMPVVQGWFFLDAIAENLSEEKMEQIDVYIVTSSISTEDRMKSRSYPFVKDYVNKPLNMDKIKNILVA